MENGKGGSLLNHPNLHGNPQKSFGWNTGLSKAFGRDLPVPLAQIFSATRDQFRYLAQLVAVNPENKAELFNRFGVCRKCMAQIWRKKE